MILDSTTEAEYLKLLEADAVIVNRRYKKLYYEKYGPKPGTLPDPARSQKRKMQKPPFQGCRHTAETKAAISLQLRGNINSLGKKVSAETRSKLRKILTGRTLSEEHRERISASNKGKRIGMKHSAETRAKMSASHKRRLELKRQEREMECMKP